MLVGEDSKEQQSNPVDHEQIDDTNELTTDDVTKLSTVSIYNNNK